MAIQKGVPIMSPCPSTCPSRCPSLRPLFINWCPSVPLFLRAYTGATGCSMHFPYEVNIRKILGHTGTLGHRDRVLSAHRRKDRV